MKSFCHFFNYLGMLTQFYDSNFTVSVLHSNNLYSLISSIYFHWSSLSVSWHGFVTLSLWINLPVTHQVFTGQLLRLWTSRGYLLPPTEPELWEPCYVAVARHASQETRHTTATVVWRRRKLQKAHVTWSLDTVVWHHLCMRCMAPVHGWTWRKHFHSVVVWRMS
jgi:hypothetical protein